MSNTYLVTGANSGLGLDSVRRLAEMADTAKVYMGCRTEQKALDAMKVLHARGIDTTKLQYVQFDASKSERELGMSYTSLEFALKEAVEEILGEPVSDV